MKQQNSYKVKAVITLAVLLMSMLLWLGCQNHFGSPTEQESVATLSRANHGIQKAISVQRKHNAKLMELDGVVGHGIGVNAAGEPVITVYTEDKMVTGIPVILDNIPVRTKVTGRFVAYTDPTTRFPRPVPIGVSTGHKQITAGTIGCRVKDGSGNLYALSNNHVFANSNEAVIGDVILQPGPYDGGVEQTDVIGTLYKFEPILFDGSPNLFDAAIADVTASTVGYATPVGAAYGSPGTTPTTAEINMMVQKYGRTTRWTQGVVKEINVTVDVCYQTRGPVKCIKLARFVNQISITPGTFSAGGDSGSLIVTDDGNKNPVALLFAGSDTRTIGSPIGAILTEFSVTIDDGEGSGPINYSPTADFTFSTSGLTVQFTDESSDIDEGGSIASWSWNFGDDIGTSILQNPTYTYNTGGTYSVTLTVTDNEGATGSVRKDVTVIDPNGPAITLTAVGYKRRGRHTVDLSWSGATTAVDIYRDGTKIKTDVSGKEYTDATGGKGAGTYVYKVCETGSQASCSNNVTVVFE